MKRAGLSTTLVVAGLFATTVFACLGPGASSLGRGAADAEPSPARAPSRQWRISWEQAGGIAGLIRRAVISSDGQAAFHDPRSGQEAITTLDASELRHVEELLDAADVLSQKGDQRSPSCRDCIGYTLEVQLDGRSQRIIADDQGLAENLRPLIEWLADRTQRALRNP